MSKKPEAKKPAPIEARQKRKSQILAAAALKTAKRLGEDGGSIRIDSSGAVLPPADNAEPAVES